MEWNKNTEKKILTKYRFTLTMKVIQVIVAALFLFWLYMLVVSMSYDALKFGQKHAFYSKVAMDWTMPNMQEEFGSLVSTEITPLLTQKISYPVFKMVGKESMRIGEIKQREPLLPFFSTRTVEYIEPRSEKEYSFFLPESPETGVKLAANEDPFVWSKLAKVHEGTVAELSFSTKEYMAPEEMYELLKPYDVDVLWMPLYTGEIKEFEASFGGDGNSISLMYNFGFAGSREAGEDFNSQAKFDHDPEFLEQNKKRMLKQMKALLENESKSYQENFLGLYQLEERYHYLLKNDFNVYGAVVTGPVKELLKLKELEQIQGAKLGDIAYWNWEG